MNWLAVGIGGAIGAVGYVAVSVFASYLAVIAGYTMARTLRPLP